MFRQAGPKRGLRWTWIHNTDELDISDVGSREPDHYLQAMVSGALTLKDTSTGETFEVDPNDPEASLAYWQYPYEDDMVPRPTEEIYPKGDFTVGLVTKPEYDPRVPEDNPNEAQILWYGYIGENPQEPTEEIAKALANYVGVNKWFMWRRGSNMTEIVDGWGFADDGVSHFIRTEARRKSKKDVEKDEEAEKFYGDEGPVSWSPHKKIDLNASNETVTASLRARRRPIWASEGTIVIVLNEQEDVEEPYEVFDGSQCLGRSTNLNDVIRFLKIEKLPFESLPEDPEDIPPMIEGMQDRITSSYDGYETLDIDSLRTFMASFIPIRDASLGSVRWESPYGETLTVEEMVDLASIVQGDNEPAPVRFSKSAALTETVTITTTGGLHMRPAEQLVNAIKPFESEVVVSYGGVEVNGRSLMSLLMLTAPQGADLQITANGPDEEQALQAALASIQAA